MMFYLEPLTVWREGNDGHLALKEELSAMPDLPVFNVLRFKGKDDAPLKDDHMVNIVSALAKSSNHIEFLLNHRWNLDIAAWQLFKEGRCMDSLVETLSTKFVPGAMPRQHLVKLDLEARTIDIRLFLTPKKLETVCGATRRICNLVEWAHSLEVKLTSPKKFKWTTFDLITVKKKYVKAANE